MTRGGGPDSSAVSSSVAGRRRLHGRADLARRAAERVGRGLDHAGDRGAGEQQHGGGEQEDRDRVRAERAEEGRGDVVEPLPREAAARLDPLGVPRRPSSRPGPMPKRAGGERERSAGEEADRAGLERAARPGARAAARGSRRPPSARRARGSGRRRSGPAGPRPRRRRPGRRPSPGRRRSEEDRGGDEARPMTSKWRWSSFGGCQRGEERRARGFFLGGAFLGFGRGGRVACGPDPLRRAPRSPPSHAGKMPCADRPSISRHGSLRASRPRARRRGRSGDRPGPPALAAHGGLRRQGHRRRRPGAGRDPGVPARPDRPRPRPAGHGRHRGRPPAAPRRGRHADPHADRARRAGLARRGARRRRRRLPGQAVRAPGAARAHARAAAPAPAARDGAAAGGRPDA